MIYWGGGFDFSALKLELAELKIKSENPEIWKGNNAKPLFQRLKSIENKIKNFDFIKKSDTNDSNIPFRVPSGLSFVTINNKTGLPSSDKESIMEAFIEGSEPYTKDDINILDSLGIINNSISGTGGLLTNWWRLAI